MSTLPKEIADHLDNLILEIFRGLLVPNHDYAAKRQAIIDYCTEQIQFGCLHPRLLETLGDHMSDGVVAVTYYRQALTLARQMGEPTHRILISIGQQYVVMKQFEIAEAYLTDGHDEAVRRKDSYSAKLAQQWLGDFTAIFKKL